MDNNSGDIELGPGGFELVKDVTCRRVLRVDPACVIRTNGFKLMVLDAPNSDMEGLSRAIQRGVTRCPVDTPTCGRTTETRCPTLQKVGPYGVAACKLEPGWLPPQRFHVGDVITYLSGNRSVSVHGLELDGPLYRVITQVRLSGYTWEYLDRGIDHGDQHRDDDDYISENSTDPMLTYWRRVLRGASRP